MNKINKYRLYAVIVAGGSGLRMKSAVKKQYIEIGGIPILARTLKIFSMLKGLKKIVLVIPEEDISNCMEKIVSLHGLEADVEVVPGGKERQISVLNGLKKVVDIDKKEFQSGKDNSSSDEREALVMIHDGVRPFVDLDTINRCIEGAVKYGACIPVVPVSDTLKRMDRDGFVSEYVDRKDLFQVQTPQTFDLNLILEAHERASVDGYSATDDASLVEKTGKKVFMTSGSGRNIKITTAEDLIFAEYIVSTEGRGDSC